MCFKIGIKCHSNDYEAGKPVSLNVKGDICLNVKGDICQNPF